MPYYYQPSNRGFKSRPDPHKPKGFVSLWLILVAALMIGGLVLFTHMDKFSLSHNSKKVVAAAPPVLTLSQAQITAMSSQINSIISANTTMDVGVAIQDLNNRQTFVYGEKAAFVAASVAKLITATDYLHGVEQGNYTLTQTVNGATAKYELQQMIEVSDNDAWSALNAILTHDGLQSYASSIGLTNYDPDQNTLTVSDISLLLGKLYKNDLLNTSDTKLLLSYMHDANYDGYIVASIPAGVTVYHKVGFLTDRVHDAAIIDNGKHPYVLVIFTKDFSGTYNSDVGSQIFSAVTKATTTAFL